MPVEYKCNDEIIHDRAFLIDFGDINANRFRAINQFTIEGSKQLRRPDIICFINGLPLAVLELKARVTRTSISGMRLTRSRPTKTKSLTSLPVTKALIISDGYNARVGSLTANQERYLPWRTIKDEDDRPLLDWQLETMVRGFFDRELFLDYIRYFVLFETDADRPDQKDCRLPPVSCRA